MISVDSKGMRCFLQRRTLLKLAALSAGAATTRSSLPEAMTPANPPVKRVLLVTKCHFDAGFIMTQAKVLRAYFDNFYPQAIQTAADLRKRGDDRYTWTTGSWLLYEYLEQATPAQRKQMEGAIAAGDITWHALPFTWQTEMLDRSMIAGGLSFSRTLDERFGHKTIGSKMTDVPGHTRGIIAPLAAGGVRLLDVGVNGGCTMPDVPDVFLWKDQAGHSLAVIYHHDYGSRLQIPGTDVAFAMEVPGDNSGPHTLAEIAKIYAELRKQYPGATVQASNLNEVAAVVDGVRATLPVVTAEIGDTWIYGVPSDPSKVAQYRETARLRRSWLQQHRFAVGDETDRQLLRHLLLAVEHTWGTDTKTYLDNDHYRPKDLALVLNQTGYTTMQASWQEKRDDIQAAITSLPPDLQREMRAKLAGLETHAPSFAGMLHHDPAQTIDTAHYSIALDPHTGALTRLRDRHAGREWASIQQPLALFTYQTLSSQDYADYRAGYVTTKADWIALDFGKPGIDKFNAVSQEWHPRLVNSWISSDPIEDRLLLELRFEEASAESVDNVAFPKQIFLDLRMPKARPRIDLHLVTLDKRANRMPEAMWLSFSPVSMDKHQWEFEKAGEPIVLADVVRGGGRAMHAVADGFRYTDAKGSALQIHTLDAPVVAFGARSPLNYSRQLPNSSSAAHISLFNNAWGTNYLMWNSGDWSYRLTLFT